MAGQFGFRYDALYRRTTLNRPNGVNTSYGYDSLSRLAGPPLEAYKSDSDCPCGAWYLHKQREKIYEEFDAKLMKINSAFSSAGVLAFENVLELAGVELAPWGPLMDVPFLGYDLYEAIKIGSELDDKLHKVDASCPKDKIIYGFTPW